ncbi:hypothetical protein D3C85_1120500 [compost metagenome]
MQAFATQGHGGGQPGIEAGAALRVGEQVGLAPAGGQQGNVGVDAGAVPVEAAKGILVVRLGGEDVDGTVVTGRPGFEGIEHGMACGRWQHVGQRHAQAWGGAEHLGMQVQLGPALILA